MTWTKIMFINPLRIGINSSLFKDVTGKKWLSTLSRTINGNTLCVNKGSNVSKESSLQHPQRIGLFIFYRSTGFASRKSADELWTSVTTVSPQGQKKGRARKLRKIINLNRGKMLGDGAASMQWPGLNSPILRDSIPSTIRKMPSAKEQTKTDDKPVGFRRRSGGVPVLMRGWAGRRAPGTAMGAPDPIGDYTFEGFDTRTLKFSSVANMTGTIGRKRRMYAFVITGNKNGLAGFGSGKATVGRAALKQAKNQAGQHLMYFPRFEDHTVYHNMYVKLHKTRIFIHKKEKGYGLVCHRALKTICEVIGIKDIHCNVEGSTKNILILTRAFLNALLHQETHQELANRTKLHVVEVCAERDNLPVVVATPEEGEVSEKPYMNEEEDLEGSFDRLYYKGRVQYTGKYHKPPPFAKLKSYKKKKFYEHKDRNQRSCQILREAGLW